MGLDADLLTDAYKTLKEGSALASEHPALSDKHSATAVTKRKKNYLNKELVYEDEGAFIYQRGDTKSKTYYLRVFDAKSRKPYIKSLGTTDHSKAVVKARTIYQEVKGKISRGERLKSITSEELVAGYLKSLHISNTPHTGVTPDTYRMKKYFLSVWEEFITSLGHQHTTIDRLPEDQLRHFASWFRQRPRKDGRSGERSIEQINNAVSEVRLAYTKYACKNRLISRDNIPELDRLKSPPSSAYKRDIFTLDQYEEYWRFLEYKYCRAKDIDAREKHIRIIFTKIVGILVNTGMRPREFLTLKWKDISNHIHHDKSVQKKISIIHIRAENSKTGKARNVVAPVRRRFEVIKQAYKDLGYEPEANDFVLFNHTKTDRRAYSRQTFFVRLKQTLKDCGLQDELDKLGHSITLYSFRHQYICWRLRYGNVPIHLIAKNCGTSIQKIDETYGHIETEKQVDVITANQGKMKKSEVDISNYDLESL